MEIEKLSYKQIVLNIKDYISLETTTIDRLLDSVNTVYIQREGLKIEKQTLKDIADIIKEGGK